MSLLNQPSRILISGDDAEWTSNNQWGGQSFNLTLPEPVVGATGIDCARAVIPNTQYPIPDYQNTFYYTDSGVVMGLTLTNSRNFTSITDLVNQLNIDSVVAGNPTFTYNTTTCRITAVFNQPQHILVNELNRRIGLQFTYPGGGPTVRFVATIATGVYYTIGEFMEAVRVALQAAANTISNIAQPAYYIYVGVNGLDELMLAVIGATSPSPGLLAIQYFDTGLTSEQIAANKTLMGIVTSTSIPFASEDVYPPLYPTTLENPVNFTPVEFSITPRANWPTQFALNTRLGFPNAGLAVVAGEATGTFLPNLIRSRVIYILCNASVNDSITTDGLRNVLAKVPVNSAFGGLTEYSPPDFNFCRIVQSSYQNVEVSLLDDNYQPYNLVAEEPLELELVFAYKEINNGN